MTFHLEYNVLIFPVRVHNRSSEYCRTTAAALDADCPNLSIGFVSSQAKVVAIYMIQSKYR